MNNDPVLALAATSTKHDVPAHLRHRGATRGGPRSFRHPLRRVVNSVSLISHVPSAELLDAPKTRAVQFLVTLDDAGGVAFPVALAQ